MKLSPYRVKQIRSPGKLTTLYNVCSVHRRVFSTSGDIMSTSEGYHEYIGWCSVHRGGGGGGISWWMWGDTMSTSGDVQYIGGIPWVHRGDTMSTSGDIMSTSGDVQYIGGVPWYLWGSNSIKSFEFLLKTPMYWTSLDVLNISRCTHDIPPMYLNTPPMYSWHPPTCIMISPRCTEHPPMYSW